MRRLSVVVLEEALPEVIGVIERCYEELDAAENQSSG